MNSTTELLDLKTLMALREAAPTLTTIPWDMARMVVKGLEAYAKKNSAHKDPAGKTYWEATLKKISAAGEIAPDVAMANVGRACRTMGLAAWREGDGYHAAWSSEQLEILKKYFKA